VTEKKSAEERWMSMVKVAMFIFFQDPEADLTLFSGVTNKWLLL